jgi:Tol biopolymer transport system component
MKRLAIVLIALFFLRCGVRPEEVLSGEDRARYLQEIGIEKILLTDARENGRHLYVLDNKSTRVRRLTTIPSFRVGSWSPDGQRIAYTENDSLNVMKEDGTEIRRVARVPQAIILSFRWSPDGALIAFRVGSPSGTVYTVRADGAGLTTIEAPWVITSGQFNNPGEIAWSPDGRLLAYEAKYTGDTVPQVYLTSPNGSGLRRLTSTPAAARNPSWSPDGLKIAFDSDTMPYVINADGTGQKQLANTFAVAPTWSPRGDALAYRSLNGSIGVMNPDGAGRRQIVGLNSGESALFQSWSPDGGRIAFVGYSRDVVSMYVVRSTGNDLRSIVDDVGSFDVRWSR